MIRFLPLTLLAVLMATPLPASPEDDARAALAIAAARSPQAESCGCKTNQGGCTCTGCMSMYGCNGSCKCDTCPGRAVPTKKAARKCGCPLGYKCGCKFGKCECDRHSYIGCTCKRCPGKNKARPKVKPRQNRPSYPQRAMMPVMRGGGC